MPFLATQFGSPTQVVGEFHAIEVDLIDFDHAAVALASLASYLESADIPLRAVARLARDDIKERFDSETAPDGSKWFALSPDYAERKEHEVGFQHPILTREGDLRDAASDAGNWSFGADSVWFSTENLPPYWRVHQEGSEDFGAVYHAAANPEGESSFEGGEQNIPPRPFIGFSEFAEGQILELFDIWFSEGVELAAKKYAISSVGTLHSRTPAGRFGPRIFF